MSGQILRAAEHLALLHRPDQAYLHWSPGFRRADRGPGGEAELALRLQVLTETADRLASCTAKTGSCAREAQHPRLQTLQGSRALRGSESDRERERPQVTGFLQQAHRDGSYWLPEGRSDEAGMRVGGP